MGVIVTNHMTVAQILRVRTVNALQATAAKIHRMTMTTTSLSRTTTTTRTMKRTMAQKRQWKKRLTSRTTNVLTQMRQRRNGELRLRNASTSKGMTLPIAKGLPLPAHPCRHHLAVFVGVIMTCDLVLSLRRRRFLRGLGQGGCSIMRTRTYHQGGIRSSFRNRLRAAARRSSNRSKRIHTQHLATTQQSKQATISLR